MTPLQIIRYTIWGLLIIVIAGSGGLFYMWNRGDFQASSLVAPQAAIGGDFTLIDTDGKTVTQKSLKGKVSGLFFGFTHCPEVCPTTITDIEGWLKELGPLSQEIEFYFISVDPERDTKDFLKQYMEAFDPRINGLTGTKEQVKEIIKAYRVFAKKVYDTEGDYTVTHTASVYLLDRDGRFSGTIAYQENSDIAMKKLKRLIADG